MDTFIRKKHLWSRFGFGIGPENISLLRNLSWEDTIQYLLDSPLPDPIAVPNPIIGDYTPAQMSVLPEDEKKELRKTDDQRLDDFRDQWFMRMTNPRFAFPEKVALFWHTHLACVCRESSTAASYANTLRTGALGTFHDLILNVAREPAMIRFLNNQQNRKASPNENFARELLELFTLGEGNYTENDIKAAARAFTGWSSTHDGKFIYRERQHDFRTKTFLGKVGNFAGEDIIAIILQQPATSTFIAKSIFKYFVHEEAESAYIAEIASVLRDSDHDIKAALSHIMYSDWFYDPSYIGNRIKSPVELLAQITHLFSAQFTGDRNLSFLQRSLGQLLFNPPNVAGWPGGRKWINNATLMIRLNLPSYMIRGSRMDHSVAASLKDEGPRKPLQFLQLNHNVEDFLSFFRSIPYQNLERNIKETLLVTNLGPEISSPRERRKEDYLNKLLVRTTSLPEFQLG